MTNTPTPDTFIGRVYAVAKRRKVRGVTSAEVVYTLSNGNPTTRMVRKAAQALARLAERGLLERHEERGESRDGRSLMVWRYRVPQ